MQAPLSSMHKLEIIEQQSVGALTTDISVACFSNFLQFRAGEKSHSDVFMMWTFLKKYLSHGLWPCGDL